MVTVGEDPVSLCRASGTLSLSVAANLARFRWYLRPHVLSKAVIRAGTLLPAAERLCNSAGEADMQSNRSWLPDCFRLEIGEHMTKLKYGCLLMYCHGMQRTV